jgi:hypothetical protein
VLDLGKLTAAAPTYTANSTGATFAFVPYKTASTNAEQTCNTIGGHLAAYTSVAEQAEVEQYYVDKVGPSRGRPGPAPAPCKLYHSLA